jgi:hypothetical protein
MNEFKNMGNYIQQVRIQFDHFPRNNQNELRQNIKSILMELDVPLDLFYGYCLGKVETRGISMITIYLTCNKQMNNIIKDGDGNLIIYCFFDQEYFAILPNIGDKKQYYVKTINQALLFLCSYYSWEDTNFNIVKSIIFNNKYIFKYRVGNPKKNRNRKIEAYVHVESDPILKKLNFYVYFEFDNTIKKILFTRTGEGYGMIEYIVNKTIWIDDELFKVIMKNKLDYWEVNVNDYVRFYYSKAESGSAHSQYNLGLMYLNGQNLIQDEEKAIYWLKKSADNGFVKSKEKLYELGKLR